MAHFHVKKRNGRPYLYVREIARVDGKPKVVSQVYIGAPGKVAALAQGETEQPRKLRVEQFGALWLAAHMDADIDIAGIIDEVVPRSPKETGPSVGEYFLYAILNRMVDATSKNQLADWYQTTAVQQIRPVDIKSLTSQRYWEKWERVSEADLDEMGSRFFTQLWKLEQPSADCVLFDTTNYFTFMAGDTDSDLAQRGRNKAGRHNLRQVGLGLLVDKASKLPLYYKAYPGNLHDSKLFAHVMDEMFGVVCGLGQTKERMTVVIDKGMNAEGNYAWIDDHKQVHFVTTYSTYFAQELAELPLRRFEPVDLERNRRLIAAERPGDCLTAYRTTGEFWGKERAVIVTHNPATARKKTYTFDAKLERLKQELEHMRSKVNANKPHWRDKAAVEERYIRLCESMHIGSDYFKIEIHPLGKTLGLWFTKDSGRIKKRKASFGRNIIVTDNIDWSTADIIQASLDRWIVEDGFRQSKDPDLVGISPIRHWTDSKIRCHLFTCIVALVYLRRLERKMHLVGIKRSAAHIMKDMKHLHSVLALDDLRKKPRRRLEQPTKTQAEVLKVLGYSINANGVLQQNSP